MKWHNVELCCQNEKTLYSRSALLKSFEKLNLCRIVLPDNWLHRISACLPDSYSACSACYILFSMSKLSFLGKLTKWMVYIPSLDSLRLDMLAWGSQHGIDMVDSGYKITRIIAPGAQPYVSHAALDSPAIYAVFHGRMVGLLGLKPRCKLTILISDSRDGEIITRACQAVGFSVVRGSIKRKAVQGAKALVDAARSGQSIAFMVDGPRGPIYEIKPGIIRLAQLTQLPIVPFVCRSRSSWWFPSWDKFMGPLWGTPLLYLFGEPVYVPQGANEGARELLYQELSNRMEVIRDYADQFFQPN